MSRYISICTTPMRLHGLLESRYSGFSAWEAFRLGDYDVVGCHATKMLLEPQLKLKLACRAMELVGLSCYYLNEYVLASQTLETVSLVHATHPVCQLFLAESWIKSGKRKLGLDLLASLKEVSHRSPELLMLLAGSFENIGASKEALGVARSACELEPENSTYLKDLSYYMVRSFGITPGSIGLAWQAVNLEPDESSFRVWLATLYKSIGEHQKAFDSIKDLTQEQISSIDCDCCLIRLQMLYSSNGRMEQAAWCQQNQNCKSVASPTRHADNPYRFSLMNLPSTVQGLV